MSTDFVAKALVALACLSCTQLPQEEEETVEIVIETTAEETKSAYYDDAALSRIVDVTLYAVEDTGFWKRAYLRSTDGVSVQGSFRFPAERQVVFYALANMGDVSLPVGPYHRPGIICFIARYRNGIAAALPFN